MIGSNTITINTATMQEIIQEYLDKRYRVGGAPVLIVKNVKVSKSGMCQMFDIDTDSKKADECPNVNS